MNSIQNILPSDEIFERREFDLQHYLEEQHKAWKEHLEVEVVEVFFDQSVLEHADRRKYYFGLIEEIKEVEGVRMKFCASSIELMARWLTPFTNRVRIIQPEALRERLEALSKELYDHYHPDHSASQKK